MGLSPSEFWSMTMVEFLTEMEWRQPVKDRYAGKLTDDVLDDIREDMRKAKRRVAAAA